MDQVINRYLISFVLWKNIWIKTISVIFISKALLECHQVAKHIRKRMHIEEPWVFQVEDTLILDGKSSQLAVNLQICKTSYRT